MNVSVNNILKILDAYQRDDALLNIHNEIHEIFIKAMQAEEDYAIEKEISNLSLKYAESKPNLTSIGVDPE